MPEVPGTPAITLGPDWVCDFTDRTKKLAVYAREGVGHVWLIDPELLTLEVFRLEAGRWLLMATFADEPRVRAEPFEAIELELDVLFSR